MQNGYSSECDSFSDGKMPIIVEISGFSRSTSIATASVYLTDPTVHKLAGSLDVVMNENDLQMS